MEYQDSVTQRAYEEGIKDALEVLEPWEPSASDREWFDRLEADFRNEQEDIDRMHREWAKEDR